MKQHNFFKLLGLLALMLVVGCSKASLEQHTTAPTQTNQPTTENSDTHVANGPMRAIKLGKKLNNPYSVANMTLALELLRDSLSRPNQTGISLDAANAVEIYTTNLYVRMCATDEASNKLLHSDPTLSLFATPRDYSVAEPGNCYIDTIGVVDPKYQWWYATVKPDFKPADGIYCEVLDELFIPRNSKCYSEISDKEHVMDNAFVSCLTIASFNLTGNQGELRVNAPNSTTTRSDDNGDQRSFMGAPIARAAATRAWITPRGRVTVEVMDNGNVKQIPVGNVRVRIARWFEEDSFYTNNSGYYVSNKSWDEFWGGFEYNVFLTGELNGCRYTMIDVFELVYVIPNERIEGISIVFDRSSKFCGPAMIQAATTNYFVNCVQKSGVHPINQRIDIQVNSPKIGGGSAAFLGVPGEIMVEYDIDKDYYSRNMSTTWHELSHASFFHNMVTHRGESFARSFWNTVYFREMQNGPNIPYGKKGDMDWENIALAEGWAYFIEDFLLQKHYGRRSNAGMDYYSADDFPVNYQMMFKELEKEAKIPITDLQRALTVNTLREFKDKLKSFYVGADDNIPLLDVIDKPITGGGGTIIGGNRPIIGGNIGGAWQPVVKKRSAMIEKLMQKYL